MGKRTVTEDPSEMTETTETTGTTETTETTETEEERTPLQIISEEFEGAPAVEMMTNWKAQFGSLHAFAPDEETVYLFRPLRRLEHKNVTRDIRELSETVAAQNNPALVEEALHEKVINSCVLYPAVTLETFTTSHAGLVPTLFNLIMEHSKFISPERAMASCYKL